MISLSTAIRAWRSTTGARAGSEADSLNQVVAHLHRLRTAVQHDLPDGWTRRVALFTAYEDVLIQACELSGIHATALHAVGHRSVHAAMSAARDLARFRTEADLEAAGIALVPPPRP